MRSYANSQNTGYLQTSGTDFTGNYRFDLVRLPFLGGSELTSGSLDIAFLGTWLNSRRIEQLPGLGAYNCKGLFGPSCGQPSPGWRHNMRFTWSPLSGKTSVSANWRYFGATGLSSNTSDPSLQADSYNVINRRIPAYNYIDLSATWKIGETLELRGGINNVFDKSPPAIDAGLLSSFGNGNTYPGIYDPLGRLLSVGVTLQL